MYSHLQNGKINLLPSVAKKSCSSFISQIRYVLPTPQLPEKSKLWALKANGVFDVQQ